VKNRTLGINDINSIDETIMAVQATVGVTKSVTAIMKAVVVIER
jgi:hypothetical protein